MYTSYLLAPGTPETGVPTMRLARLQDEPFDTALRNAGMNVADALLASVQGEGAALFRATPVGQHFERTATQQAVMDWLSSPVVWIIGAVLLVLLVRRA